jgi:hypothetical protein
MKLHYYHHKDTKSTYEHYICFDDEGLAQEICVHHGAEWTFHEIADGDKLMPTHKKITKKKYEEELFLISI